MRCGGFAGSERKSVGLAGPTPGMFHGEDLVACGRGSLQLLSLCSAGGGAYPCAPGVADTLLYGDRYCNELRVCPRADVTHMTEQATSTECSAQRWHITIEYDGGRFRGWQRHAHACTVQGTIEDALWRFCGERAEVCGAGRTDSGVHALAQSAHLDIVRKVESFRLRDGLNFHLRGSGVCILAAAHVPASFHARFSATQRIYMYRISNRRAPPCLDAQRLWFVPQRLCVERVREAARLLVGRHDFSSFRCVGCTSPSSVRTLDYVDIARQGEHVRMIFAARSFLYRQVRAMVGVWSGSD